MSEVEALAQRLEFVHAHLATMSIQAESLIEAAAWLRELQRKLEGERLHAERTEAENEALRAELARLPCTNMDWDDLHIANCEECGDAGTALAAWERRQK